MSTAIALTFLLITTMFTAFVCIMSFALLGAFQKMLDSVTKVVDMTQDILQNGFEIEYTEPEQQESEQETEVIEPEQQESEQETEVIEPVDNTGKITNTSEIVDGVLRIYLPENCIKEEFENPNN